MSTNTLHKPASCLPADMLHKLMPPQGVIHVGAGKGLGDMNCWQQWNVPRALLIDADPARLAWAEKLAANNAGWQVREAVLAAQQGEAEFHQASNPDEDGLLPAEALQTIWPNLKNKGQVQKQTSPLQLISEQSGWLPADSNDLLWLLVDCLPALPVLEGAGSMLSKTSVIWVRVLLDPPGTDNGASLQEMQAWLTPKGYCCVHVAEGNHPAIGHALFARDWAAACQHEQTKSAALHSKTEQLTQERDGQAKQIADMKAQAEQLTKDRDAQSKLAQENQAQLEKIAAERDSLAKQLTELNTQTEQLTAQRDAHAKQVSELKAQAEQLTKEREAHSNQLADVKAQLEKATAERDSHAKQLTELKTQAEQLTTQRDAHAKQITELKAQAEQLTKDRDAQTQLAQERQGQLGKVSHERDSHAKQCSELKAQTEQLTKERDEQSKLVQERQERINQLIKERDEQTKLAQDNKAQEEDALKKLEQIKQQSEEVLGRQHLINDEITRAEAQIDLIKDLLLREPGL